MPCVSSAASCHCLPRFPPRARGVLHRAVLDEILEERVVSGRGRQVPRGLKRKMSSYPLRPRTPQPTTRIDVTDAIQIVKLTVLCLGERICLSVVMHDDVPLDPEPLLHHLAAVG